MRMPPRLMAFLESGPYASAMPLRGAHAELHLPAAATHYHWPSTAALTLCVSSQASLLMLLAMLAQFHSLSRPRCDTQRGKAIILTPDAHDNSRPHTFADIHRRLLAVAVADISPPPQDASHAVNTHAPSRWLRADDDIRRRFRRDEPADAGTAYQPRPTSLRCHSPACFQRDACSVPAVLNGAARTKRSAAFHFTGDAALPPDEYWPCNAWLYRRRARARITATSTATDGHLSPSI